MSFAWIAVVAALLTGPGPDEQQLTDSQRLELARYYGFGPMQIYKLDPGIASLRIADVNADGLSDIVLWNAYRSRLEVFYQPGKGENAEPAKQELEPNEVPNRGNMRNEHVPVAYRLATFDVAELTGDGRPDIVFFGEPKEVVILPGLESGGFGPATGVRAPEGEPHGGSLVVGDFNSDRRADVALLGQEVIQLFYQKADGGLGKAERIIHGVKQPLLMLTIDLDGDGRDDLLIGADDEEYGVSVLLQQEKGGLGPVQRIDVPRLRSWTAARNDGADDLFGIEYTTGRMKQYRWEEPRETAAAPDWAEFLYPYPIQSKSKRRPLAVGDITGDGLADVVIADPDAAQLILFKQGPQGLDTGVPFPGLVGTVDALIADADNNGKPELLSVSTKEKMIGASHMAEGRLSFPDPIAAQGEPLAVAVGSLKAGQKPDHRAYLSREDKKAVMHVEPFSGEGRTWALESLDDDPEGLVFADVNQDGLNDLLLFVRFSAMQTFIQKSNGEFEALAGADARAALVKEAPLAGFALADVSGDGQPEVLLAQKNFARALRVEDGRWTVVDQYNPESADAQIDGLAVLPAESGAPVIVLYDRKGRELLVFRRREDSAYAVAQKMPVGNLELTAMLAAPVGPGGRMALVLADESRLAVYEPDAVGRTLVERHSYETDAKDAWLADSVVGDLNRDGRRDVALLDMGKASLEVLATLPGGGFARALRFQVFQGKQFSGDPRGGREPHEILVGDVTGDGTDDIAVLVHDRLIVYPGQ